MGLTRLIAERLDKSENIAVTDIENIYHICESRVNEYYRVTLHFEGNRADFNKAWLKKIVVSFHEVHNTTPKRIEVVYDSKF